MGPGDGGGGQFEATAPITLRLLGLQPLCGPRETVSASLTFPSVPQLVG